MTAERTRKVRASAALFRDGAGLDPLVHERVRLGILAALAAESPAAFTDLRDALGLTDGNLAVHGRRLEEAGYVVQAKRFRGEARKTEFSITPKGRAALASYLDRMDAILRNARNA
ncbi:MAG: hypothetical protein HMLKMBBP_00193 [Planctomycetes bacterium]|nr:hypothetical protein [Planctomycetota bacterium]